MRVCWYCKDGHVQLFENFTQFSQFCKSCQVRIQGMCEKNPSWGFVDIARMVMYNCSRIYPNLVHFVNPVRSRFHLCVRRVSWCCKNDRIFWEKYPQTVGLWLRAWHGNVYIYMPVPPIFATVSSTHLCHCVYNTNSTHFCDSELHHFLSPCF